MVASTNVHIEVKEISGHTQQLRSLLLRSPLSFSEEDNSSEGAMNQELYRTEDLEAIVQASRNEILESLSKFKAFLYRGYWRILSEDAEYDVVDQMQLIIRAEGYARR